jgi:hypothetical protein
VGWIIGKVPEGSPPPDKTKQIIDLAYRLHYASLILTQEGIPTIWIIGSFAPAAAVAANPGYSIPAGIAYGLVPGDEYLKPKAEWHGAQRRPLPELFFNLDTNSPFTDANAGDLLDFLQALRSGPTGMNKQPWRFVIGGGKIHIFNLIGTDPTWYDIGIGLANIAYLLKDKGVTAQFVVLDPAPPAKLEGAYVVSANLS